MGSISKISPVTFGLALLCFFLPFFSFSCQGQKVATLSGWELATGTTVNQPQMFGPPQPQKVEPKGQATAALVCVAVGLISSFVSLANSKVGGFLAAAPAAFGAGLLVALDSSIEGDLIKQGGGVVKVNCEAGFYLALIFLLASLGLCLFALFAKPSASALVAAPASSTRFCTQCGTRCAREDVFCEACGAKFA